MGAPDNIKRLVDTFHNNLDSFKSGSYNETQVRREFIDPLFTSLGWDVDNKAGYAEAYKDVIHEFSLKTKDVTEAPDYCFRIGGTKKFFVEAKKPSVNVKDDIHPSFQLRRYAWTAKLPLSILTDFEEFAVYDTRVLPKKTDKSSTGRIMFHSYQDYIDQWDDIESIFSREAVLKGSFDKYVESNKKKKGTAEVDEVFLDQMEEWRKTIAKNIALRNPALTIRELNYAVQKTIDRIIFLRICEDRGIEDYGQLMNLLNGTNVYDRLKQIYYRADEKYNSGLFHFEKEKDRIEPPDNLTLDLVVDDKTIKDVIKNLYYPDSPYEFSVLPADILGQVYEQFLGKVIRLTPAHFAVVEDKPEVKKAGGVYYTPTYIVDYIVQNTLGKSLTQPSPKERAFGKGRTPNEISKLRILDPACGSGSFLIGAYEYLLNYHLEYYNKQFKEGKLKTGNKNSPVYETDRGDIRLTTSEKKRILLNNIYGVDIDPQAVEVTKLSLLLKVLEGESDETLTNQMRMFRERALPDLSNNIKCGNSLIGPDFYEQPVSANPRFDGMEMQFLDDEEKMRINVFDWHTEFPQVFRPHPESLSLPRRGTKGEVHDDTSGFDVVIGNPPYVRQELIGSFKEYFENNYKVYNGIADLYSYFIERAVNLLKDGGYFSYIVANKWIRANYGLQLREWLKEQNIIELIDFGDLPVFKGATTYPCILTIKKDKPANQFHFAEISDLDFTDLKKEVDNNKLKVNLQKMDSSGWKLVKENVSALLNKISSQGVPLIKYVDGKIFRGVLTGLNKAFVIDKETKDRLIKEDAKCKELIKPFLAGRDIKRYLPPPETNYLILVPKGFTNKNSNQSKNAWKWFSENYSAIANYLSQFEDDAKKRYDKGDYWWELRACDYYDEFEKPKIMLPDISLRGNFTFDLNGGTYCVNTAYIIGSSDKYLLSILNSKAMDFYYRNLSSTYRGGYLRYIYQYMAQLPIPILDDKVKGKLEAVVEQIMNLYLSLNKAKTPQERTTLQRQIEATDKQIDQLVYQLYELTEEEIRIVEETTSS